MTDELARLERRYDGPIPPDLRRDALEGPGWRLRHARCEKEGTKEFIIDGPPGAHHGQFSHEDDARLIAAAPELLATLEEIAAFAVGYGDVCEIIAQRARAAVAKAWGEQPKETAP